MKSVAPKVTLLVILAMFTLPLILAWMMNSGSIPYQPGNTVNQGRLVSPVVPLDWSGVEPIAGTQASTGYSGFWVILYAVPVVCNALCLESVTMLRQVHRASGRDQERIKVTLLVEPTVPRAGIDQLIAIDPGFNLVTNPTGAFVASLARVDDQSGGVKQAPTIYLLDPLGNIMLTYNGESGPTKLSKDLKRLLAWSIQDKRS
jgi:hypothetical protein